MTQEILFCPVTRLTCVAFGDLIFADGLHGIDNDPPALSHLRSAGFRTGSRPATKKDGDLARPYFAENFVFDQHRLACTPKSTGMKLGSTCCPLERRNV